MARSDTQFKPGQSGNPGGRPKGKSIRAELNALLDKKVRKKTADDRRVAMTLHRALAESLLEIALSKRYKARDRLAAIKEVLDRTEGKALERVQQEGISTLNIKILKDIDHGPRDQ